jgi:cytochrome c oxidase subunit II
MPALPSLFLALLMLAAGAAPADAVEGYADPWQLNFQPPATPSMESLVELHDLLLWIISVITLFVLGLLAYACYRFRASRQPLPSKRTHHTALEIAWTAIPVLILIVIAVPSFKLLYFMDRAVAPELTLKATGNQWFWSYEYPGSGDFSFDAYMVADADLQPGQPRLLTTDTQIVLPVETDIRLLATANDVIHSWAMPRFGVKLDAIPGLLNETWFRIEEPGIYYGQCSELCGDFHGFMPIMVRAVSKDEFQQWLEQAKQEYAKADSIDVAARATSK